MAIFQIKVDYISRNKKVKPTKNLSYISRGTGSSGIVKNSLLYIAREDKYSNRDDLIHYEEKNMPKEFENGKDFAETMEKHSRKDARFLKKYEMSLPREFSDKENIQIAKEFCEQKFGSDYVYFLAVHNPVSKSDGIPHPHLHLNVFESKLDGLAREKEKYFKNPDKKNPERGGTGVNREMSTTRYFEKFCNDWETHLNKNLVRNGFEKLDPKKDKIEIKNSILKEEKTRGYSKAEIEKMDTKEVRKILSDSEKKIHENEKKIKRLYQKNMEREVLNELSGNKLYKLENKIKSCEALKRNSNFSTKERGDYLRQGKVLKEEKEKLLNEHKGTEKYFKLKEKKEREKKAELRKLNMENRKLKSNIEKIIKNRPTEEMEKIKESIKVIKSQNLEKNVRSKNQKNKIKKDKSSYTENEKKMINKKYDNSMSKTIQAIRLVTKINALKNIGKTEQESATKISNAKVSKKYERLKKGGFIFDDMSQEKTKSKNVNYKKENKENYKEKEEQTQEQNYEQERGRTRSRSR